MTLRRSMSQAGGVVRLAGAHNPLSARLAEQAGFDGVWASSFEIATSLGMPDAGLLPWRELLAVAVGMRHAVEIPIVADCETGFGGPEVVREMAAAYAEAGIAAICMEDGASPRRNSLLGGPHGLSDCQEFAAKLEQAKSTAGEMLVIARVQSFVAGRDTRDALHRAHSYAASGADAIVIHSRRRNPDEVMRFVEAWDRPTPLVLIPTTYHQLTVEQIRRSGKVGMVIYANHGLRAAIAAMKRVFQQILAEGASHGVEPWIATLDEAFALQQHIGEEPRL